MEPKCYRPWPFPCLGLIYSEPGFPPFWNGSVKSVPSYIVSIDLILQGLCLSFCHRGKHPVKNNLREKGFIVAFIMVRKMCPPESLTISARWQSCSRECWMWNSATRSQSLLSVPCFLPPGSASTFPDSTSSRDPCAYGGLFTFKPQQAHH